MTFVKTMNIALISLSLSACAISVGDGRDFSHDDRDSMSVKLPSGGRTSFSCPKGLTAFVVRDSNDEMAYGCRTSGADNLTIDQ